MATPEAHASHEVRKRANDWKIKLYRNNSGVLVDKTNRPVRFGLGNESTKINKQFKTGDYVGWTPILITPEMVGKQVAVFTNIEVKAKGFVIKKIFNENSREYAQNNFNTLVTSQGGIAGFASDWQSFDEIINNFHREIKK